MPGASAGSAGTIYPGVQGVSSVGRAAIANQTPFMTASATGASSAVSAGGFNPLQLLMAISGLGTMASSYTQSKAQRAESDFNASIFESNARLQALQAEDAIIRGDKEAVKAKQAAKRLIGSQRAAMGAQGIDLESGSALDIQQETASLGAETALNIKNNAWREAWGYRAQESDLRSRANYARITGRNTSKNTLLTGGLTVAKNLATYQYLSKNKGSSDFSDYLANYGGGL